jgi:hypothetical protein
VAEGARLESVYTGNRIVGSNPTPSATRQSNHLKLQNVFHDTAVCPSGCPSRIVRDPFTCRPVLTSCKTAAVSIRDAPLPHDWKLAEIALKQRIARPWIQSRTGRPSTTALRLPVPASPPFFS